MKIAVLGGGSGAQATAADLSLAGHEIRLAELAPFAENIAAMQALGGIHLTGVAPMGGASGFARVHLATVDIRAAVRGADLIMVIVPAYGHEAFMRELVACAENGQLVVFAGYFGALAFGKMLADAGRKDDLLVAETASLIYICRVQGSGRVWIKAGKQKMPFAALPASRTPEALNRIHSVYPQLVPAQNVFETGTNEAGLLVHPVTTLLNLSRIEQIGPYRSTYYDLTPGVGRIMDAVDGEKQALQAALGLRQVSLPMLIHEFFGVTGANSYEIIHACPNYSSQTTPDNLQHRYVTEDVPFGLVPIVSIGGQLGLEMRVTRGLISLASAANGEDYLQTGRTAERLGLSGMSRDEMIQFVSCG